MEPYKTNDTTVVLLAAGRGSRMRSLTENTPKPLLKVGQLTLIEHHLVRLHTQGFRHIVINLAYFGEQIRDHLKDGERYGLTIGYSDESDTGALETAGGLKKALPLIQSDPFLVVNSDIWTDFSFDALLTPLDHSGRIVLVDNPEHNLNGDFYLSQNKLSNTNSMASDRFTFSGIALYRKSLFKNLPQGKYPLGPLLKSSIDVNDIEGIKHSGQWTDVGTPERLRELNEHFAD